MPVTSIVSLGQHAVAAGLKNEAYLYDKVGNVIQRQNNNLGLTENFFYDNLYRLDHSVLGSSTNLQMAYDAMGNIDSRSDVAAGTAWTYDPIHKCRVTQAGSASYSYSYDANGNVSVRNGSTIGWTSYNYPSSVGTATESATFDYGPNRQRWRMTYNGSSGIETSYYVSPLFEAVFTSAGTDFRHYLYADGKPVGIISRMSSGVVSLRSLLTDHQGSVSTIVAESTGTFTANESFTAYGNRREATTWSGAPTGSELAAMNSVTREGYTFQTVLGSMGLSVQDAILGKFLSADPSVPEPGNTQSFNRYTYANNNPETRIDPTGFDDCDDCDSSPYAANESDWASGWSEIGTTSSNGTLWAVPSSQVSWTGFSLTPDTLVNWQNSGAGVGSSYWQDYHSEAITKLNPDGTDSGEPPDSDGLVPLQVLARRSDWISSAECGISIDCGFDFAAFGRALAPYNPGLAAAQFLAIGVGGAGAGLSGGYAAIGALAGAAGGYKTTHTLTGTLMGAGIGSLTGGSSAAIDVTAGLGGVAYTSGSAGVSAAVSTASVNVLTGQPISQNVINAAAIGALSPLATGEAMVVGGGAVALGSATAYVLNAASNAFSVTLGP